MDITLKQAVGLGVLSQQEILALIPDVDARPPQGGILAVRVSGEADPHFYGCHEQLLVDFAYSVLRQFPNAQPSRRDENHS